MTEIKMLAKKTEKATLINFRHESSTIATAWSTDFCRSLDSRLKLASASGTLTATLTELPLLLNKRPTIWKLYLLNSDTLKAQLYKDLVRMGPSRQFDKIHNDIHRTFRHDTRYHAKVTDTALIRVLNTFVWQHADVTTFSYVQGLNVIAGVLLYVMSELDASYLLNVIITRCAPKYFQPQLDGVHAAVTLVEQVIKHCDPALYAHLLNTNMRPEMYAFARK